MIGLKHTQNDIPPPPMIQPTDRTVVYLHPARTLTISRYVKLSSFLKMPLSIKREGTPTKELGQTLYLEKNLPLASLRT